MLLDATTLAAARYPDYDDPAWTSMLAARLGDERVLEHTSAYWNCWTLVGAMQQGRVAIVRRLVEARCPANRWALAEAAANNRCGLMIMFLRTHKSPVVDIDLTLCAAAAGGHLHALSLLHKLGFRARDPRALLRAARGNERVVRYLERVFTLERRVA